MDNTKEKGDTSVSEYLFWLIYPFILYVLYYLAKAFTGIPVLATNPSLAEAKDTTPGPTNAPSTSDETPGLYKKKRNINRNRNRNRDETQGLYKPHPKTRHITSPKDDALKNEYFRIRRPVLASGGAPGPDAAAAGGGVKTKSSN